MSFDVLQLPWLPEAPADFRTRCKALSADTERVGTTLITLATTHLKSTQALELAVVRSLPTHIYYFATPRIFLQKEPGYDREVYERSAAFYVDGFNHLCTHFAGLTLAPISLLYPQTVAVTERPAGMTEYAMAKAAGELLSAELMRLKGNLHIDVVRLPRIPTDQTATVQQTADERPEDIMLPLLGG